MDTKLKNNKKSLNWIIYLIVISTLTLMVSALIYNRNVPQNEEEYVGILNGQMDVVCDVVYNLSTYADDISGNLKEESVEDQVNYRRSQVELYKSGVNSAKYYEEDLARSDEEIRQAVIYNFKEYVDNCLRNLRDVSNIEFYYESKTDGKVYTNTDAVSKEEFEEEAVKNNKENIYIKNGVYARIAENLIPGDHIYTAAQNYKRKNITGYVCIALIIISCINAVFSVIKLSINRKKQTLERKETFFSKVYWSLYTEVKVIVTFIMISVVCLLCDSAYGYNIYLLIAIPLTAFAIYIIVLDLMKLTSLKEEEKLIRKKSLIFKILRYFKVNFIGYLKETKLVKSTFSKVIGAMIIHSVYTVGILIFLYILKRSSWFGNDALIFIIFIIIVAVLLIGNVYILKIGCSLNKIVLGSKRISEGNYDEKIDVKGPIILRDIADNIENIQLGLKDAVGKAVKSEKMKGELITNVSHDLKTPLTSIINYVDLLDQKNVSEEEKEKYIKVLKEKSNRLKVLIEDLFEVSKASSGNMELNMDNIDVVSLLTQTLVELDDKIEASGLKFIKSFPKEKITIYADGRKLFRVFQNLLSNIFKYSMKNSRVYIEVKDNIDYVEVIFKNISEYELNFTEEEILRRFKRGDESRTTEGSGLGLSIAKSLVELQRGKFEIHIDGDLFKVTIKLVKDSKLNEESRDRK